MVNLTTLSKSLSRSSLCFPVHHDLRSFSCPNSFRAEHNKEIPVEAEYDNNKYNNNNFL